MLRLALFAAAGATVSLYCHVPAPTSGMSTLRLLESTPKFTVGTAAAEAAAGEGTEVCSNPVRISETTANHRAYRETCQCTEAFNIRHIGDVSSRGLDGLASRDPSWAGRLQTLEQARAGSKGPVIRQ